ncbi:MAG: hypothetical protein AAFZ91_00085 [Pseudomonadota bacterium]
MLRVFAIGAFTASTLFGVANAQDALESSLSAFVVSSDDTGKETLVETEEIAPGETIEYVLTYKNVSDSALSGIVVSAPVPASTIFVADSASTDTDALFEVSADDGATWATPPLTRQTDNGDEIIPPAEYDMVRWTPEAAIEAGISWGFEYRISVQ